MDGRAARALQRLKTSDGGVKLHAVVRGHGLATAHFAYAALRIAENGSPAAHAGIRAATSIGPDIDEAKRIVARGGEDEGSGGHGGCGSLWAHVRTSVRVFRKGSARVALRGLRRIEGARAMLPAHRLLGVRVVVGSFLTGDVARAIYGA